MFALLTQRLAEKIFARQHSGRQQRALSEYEPCTLFPLLQKYPHSLTWKHPPPNPTTSPQPPNTSRMQTCGTHGRTRSKVSETARKPPDEKTPPHKRPFAYAGRGPFYSAGQCLCWLFFVCTFLSTKSNRKKGAREGKKKKKEVRQACKHNRWHVQTYTRSRYLLNNFLFSNHVDPLHILWSG